MRYGYARVSTKEQNPARQIDALLEAGVEYENIYTDLESGKDFDRSKYKKLMHKLRKGDTLVIKSIDRLGRNYEEILEQWDIITRKKDVNIEIIDVPVISSDNKTLVEVFIANIILQLQSYFAQAERDQIRQRQAEGIIAAKQRGIHFGRPYKEKPSNYDEIKLKWQNGRISAREAARQLKISHSTFLRWVNEEINGR